MSRPLRVQIGGRTVQVRPLVSGVARATEAVREAVAAQEAAEAAAAEAAATNADRADRTLSNLTSAASARTNLGLGSIATQAANDVTISGGNISGIVDLAVADGGTGASTASAARTNLGLGNSATRNVGTSAGTVAEGDDSRITGASQKAQNLGDLANIETANRVLGLFATRAQAVAATVSSALTRITLMGYSAAGDAPRADYKRVVSEPSHPGKLQSADGAWWEYVPGQDGVDPRHFGAVLAASFIGLADSSAALNNAASVARALREQLTLRLFKFIRIEAAVDLTDLRMIDIQSPIYCDPSIVAVPVTVGGYAGDGTSMVYRLPRVDDGSSFFDDPPPSRPLLRFVGVKGAEIHYGDCQYVQFYAEAAEGSAFNSNGYCNVFPSGLQHLVEFTDDGAGNGTSTGWTNEINVWGGRFFKLRVIGDAYGHNRIRVHSPCIEGPEAEITFSNCSSCFVYGVRGEGMGSSAGVSFDADTIACRVTFDWIGTGSPEDDFRLTVPVSDLGRGNLVTTEAALAFEPALLFCVNPQSGILSTGTDTIAPDPRISPDEYGFVAEFGLGRALLDPGLSDFGFAANQIIVASDRIPVVLGQVIRWNVDFDGALLRPYIVVYGADGKPLTSEGGGGTYIQFTNMGSLSATHGAYGVSSDLTADQINDAPIEVKRSEVKFVRVGISAGTAGRARSIAATTYVRGLTEVVAKGIAQGAPRLLTLDGTPTKGFVPTRTTVRNRSGNSFLDCDFSYETTVNGALSTGATSVTVTTIGSVANGDVVGIVMDNGAVHWTAVSGLSGSSFTIAAIPASRSVANGARIVFNRWA